MTGQETVNLRIWGVVLRHPIYVGVLRHPIYVGSDVHCLIR